MTSNQKSLVETIARFPATLIFKGLSTEPVVVIAWFLSQTPAKVSAEVLKQFNAALRTDILTKIASLSHDPIQNPEQLLFDLIQKLKELEKQAGQTVDGFGKASEILRSLNDQDAKQILEGLRSTKPELAQKMRDQLWQFLDIEKLGRQDTEKLLSRINENDLLLALRQCPESLKTQLLSALSQRRRDSIVESMKESAKAKVSDVQEAQRRISEIAEGLYLDSKDRV